MSRLQDLPLLHPSLAIHLSDPADASIISSAAPSHSPSVSIPPPSSPQPPPPPTTTTATLSSKPYPLASSRAAALTSLNRSALASYTAAQRLGLGSPARIMVEFASSRLSRRESAEREDAEDAGGVGGGGPVVLNTYIPPLPQQHAAAAAAGGGAGGGGGTTTGDQQPGDAAAEEEEDDDDDGARRPPLLVAVVVAPEGESHTVAEARLAASRLARVGRRLQATWAEEEGAGEGGGGG